MPEQPKVVRNLVIRMLWSVMSKAAKGSSTDKPTHNHNLRPEVDYLLHATRRFQCCDIFGRQIGTTLEGCETVNAAKTVSGQHAPVPLTRMANWKQGGSVSSSSNQLAFLNRGLTRACLNHWGIIPDDKDFIYDTGHNRNSFIQSII